MHQSFRSALGLMTLLALAAGEARAQFYGGYGGYGGWGGWGGGGSTVQGDFARGAGYLRHGRGAVQPRYRPGHLDQRRHDHALE